MPQPGPHGAVHDDGQSVDRVEAETDRYEGGGVVEGGLHRVHVGPREGGGVVGLVVEAVNLAVEELTEVRHRGRPPGVHGAVHEVEVRDPVVGQQERHHQVEDRGLGQGGGEAQPASCPAVTEEDFYHGGEAAGRGRHQGVVADLRPAGVDRVHLVLVQLLLQRGEVEEPVPEAADEEGGDHVPQQDVRHPANRELSRGTEGRVDKAELSCGKDR